MEVDIKAQKQNKQIETMRIIHFSDFYLQGGKMLRLHQINAKKLMDALVKVNQRHKIDIVVFGGDLIDCGGKSFGSIQEGFKAFEDVVLKPLMQTLNLPNDHVIIVSGNHDKDIFNFK